MSVFGFNSTYAGFNVWELISGLASVYESSPDIHRKLQKLAMGPDTNSAQLVEAAFSVLSNWDEAEDENCYWL